MAHGTSDMTSPAHRPPTFGVADRSAPTSVAATVASALAASAFHFGARAVRGEWPLPPMSDAACNVMSRMLCHAAAVSATLARRHYVMILLPHEVELVEATIAEIAAATFPMPVEGGTYSVPMITSAEVHAGRLWFSLNDTYTAHARAVGALGAWVWSQASEELTTLAGAGESIAIDDAERQLLVAGLRAVLHQRTVGWNFHAVERLGNGYVPEAPDAFGIPQAVAMLRKLGASPGSGGF